MDNLLIVGLGTNLQLQWKHSPCPAAPCRTVAYVIDVRPATGRSHPHLLSRVRPARSATPGNAATGRPSEQADGLLLAEAGRPDAEGHQQGQDLVASSVELGPVRHRQEQWEPSYALSMASQRLKRSSAR